MTTPAFALWAEKNGIIHAVYSNPPNNLDDLRERLNRARKTPSPSESEYELYTRTVFKACNETTMAFEVGVQLLKRYHGTGYQRAFSQSFTGFPKDVGFKNCIPPPNPGLIEGLEIWEYLLFPVDEQISGATLFKDESAYDGAALAYASNDALSYIGKPDPPGESKVTMFTTDGTTINFFAHHTAPSEDGGLEYYQYPLASTNLTNSFEDFKRGRRQLRDLQDDARAMPYSLRDELKEYWRANEGLPPNGFTTALAPGPRVVPTPDTDPLLETLEELPEATPTSVISRPGRNRWSGSRG